MGSNDLFGAVDVTELAHGVDMHCPVAICQSVAGTLGDTPEETAAVTSALLLLARKALSAAICTRPDEACDNEHRTTFGDGGELVVSLRGGDAGEPVVTIGLPADF